MGRLSQSHSKIGHKPNADENWKDKSPGQKVLIEHAYCGGDSPENKHGQKTKQKLKTKSPGHEVLSEPAVHYSIPSPSTCGYKGYFSSCNCIIHESHDETVNESLDEADAFYVIIDGDIHKYEEH